MSHPIIADNKPVKVSLSKGQEYHFCTCGRSRSQPFCDGPHADTEFTPQVIVSDEDHEAYLCACKHTGNAPFCDGTIEHRDQDRPPVVTVTSNGPYTVTGGIELLDQKMGDGASPEHYALCRCGASRNNPFCDGSHWRIGFED